MKKPDGYPYDKVEQYVKWFKSVYEEIIHNEGWSICPTTIKFSENCTLKVYMIIAYVNIDSELILKGTIGLVDACILAENYGLVLQDNIIFDYDETKHITNKHLAEGNKLGLL